MSEINNSQSTQNGSKVYSYEVPKAVCASYASIAQNEFPKRDQGLIIDCVGSLTLTDYTCAVAKVVAKKNILYATRISNNRVCLYLSTKELIEEITTKHKYLQVGDTQFTIRPLTAKHQRVIFSNVPPPISHSVLEDILENVGINRKAPIITLKASLTEDGFNHVLSSRRQTYIDTSDVEKLPDLLKITYEDITYYIYPSIGQLKCFTCKMEGHIAKYCTTNPEETPNNGYSHISENVTILEDNSTKPSTERKLININSTTSNDVNKGEQIVTASHSLKNSAVTTQNYLLPASNQTQQPPDLFQMPPPAAAKRPPPASTSSSCSENDGKSKPLQKKSKAADSDENIKILEILGFLKPAAILFQKNASTYPVNINTLAEFLVECHGSRNVVEISQKYTHNKASINTMLSEVHDVTVDKNLRGRIKRIIKRLNKKIEEDTGTDSCSPSGSQESLLHIEKEKKN